VGFWRFAYAPRGESLAEGIVAPREFSSGLLALCFFRDTVVQKFLPVVRDHRLPVLAAEKTFLSDRRFLTLLATPESLLAGGIRCAVLEFLVNNYDVLSQEFRRRMLGWRHCSLSALPLLYAASYLYKL